MGVTYGFYNGKDRLYDARQLSRVFEGVVSEGIIAGIGDLFTCRSTGGNNILIGTGFGYFKGFYVYNETTYTYSISNDLFESYNFSDIEISKNPQTEYPSGNPLDLGDISVVGISSSARYGQCYIVIELDEINRLFTIKAIKISDFNDNTQIPIAIVFRDDNTYTRVQNLVGYSGKWRAPCDNGYYSDLEIIGPNIIHNPIISHNINDVYDYIHDSMYEFYCDYFDPNKLGSKTDEFNSLITELSYYLYHHDSGPSQYNRFVSLLDLKETKPIIVPVTLEVNSYEKTIQYTVPDNKILTIESRRPISIKNIKINPNSVYISYSRLSTACKIYLIIHDSNDT